MSLKRRVREEHAENIEDSLKQMEFVKQKQKNLLDATQCYKINPELSLREVARFNQGCKVSKRNVIEELMEYI